MSLLADGLASFGLAMIPSFVMADCLALRSAMQDCKDSRLVVIGGGFIGLEVASTARKLQVPVTIIEPAPQVLPLRMGQRAATRLIDLHVDRGVDFRFNVGVARFLADADNRVSGLVLTDGTSLAATVVLTAIGCAPNVEWLAGTDNPSGLRLTLSAARPVSCSPCSKRSSQRAHDYARPNSPYFSLSKATNSKLLRATTRIPITSST